jgi:RNA polymerase sigma factor (sigma-70 family)
VVTALYAEHYAALVRLAAFLVHDMATAEKVVQDSFVAVYAAWRRLPDADDALCFLRQSVVNRSRLVLRDRPNRNPPEPAPAAPGAAAPGAAEPGAAEPGAERRTITGLEYPAVISALRALPARQREVLVLRYYANLSETQIAQVMGISRSAVKRHSARAAAALAAPLDSECQ